MISVIIPVYNSGKYLADCLNSVLSQSYKELEIICVNDGSTDDSADILEEYARKDGRIHVIHQQNAGVSAARNAGLQAANGSHIAFVDSDDALDPQMYDHLLRLMDTYCADIAHCGYRKVYADGSAKEVCGTGELLVQDFAEAAGCLLAGRHFTGGLWNKLYRAELLEGVRFDSALKMNEDILMNAILFSKAKTIVFQDVPLYHYYERSDSSCSTTAALKKKKDAVAAAEAIYSIYKDTPVEQEAARKLHYVLCDLHRAYLMTGDEIQSAKLREVHNRIVEITPSCGNLSRRAQLNYRLMSGAPRIYALIYRIYDKIRKPNWDL